MTTMAVIAVEGVLSLGDDLRNSPPTSWGRALYDGLRSQFRVVLFTEADNELAKWWLRREMFRDYAAVMTQEPYLTYDAWKVRQIQDFLAEGWEVGLMIDVDVKVLTPVSEMGVLTLAVSHPRVRVGWKPHEVAPRPWGEVADSL